jgi:hypothetical protein
MAPQEKRYMPERGARPARGLTMSLAEPQESYWPFSWYTTDIVNRKGEGVIRSSGERTETDRTRQTQDWRGKGLYEEVKLSEKRKHGKCEATRTAFDRHSKQSRQ